MTLLALLGCVGGPPATASGSGPESTDTSAADFGSDADDTGDRDTGEADTGADDTGEVDTAPTGPDADGDGSVDAAADGADCDDGDSRVHPGADEWCDAADWNCDGDPYDGQACGKAQDLGVIAAGTWDGDTGEDWQASGVFLGDLDGDGTDDVGLVGTGTSSDTPEGAFGGVFYVPGGQAVSFGMSHTETATAWWHGNDDNSSLGTPHAAGGG